MNIRSTAKVFTLIIPIVVLSIGIVLWATRTSPDPAEIAVTAPVGPATSNDVPASAVANPGDAALAPVPDRQGTTAVTTAGVEPAVAQSKNQPVVKAPTHSIPRPATALHSGSNELITTPSIDEQDAFVATLTRGADVPTLDRLSRLNPKKIVVPKRKRAEPLVPSPRLEEHTMAFNNIDDRVNYEVEITKNPETGRIPEGIYGAEKEQAMEILASQQQRPDAPDAFTFSFAGPENLGGRTRSIKYDVRYDGVANRTILACGVSGGVYKSTDDGATWVRKSPTGEHFSCTSIAQDPRATFQDTWYYAVGEALGNSASLTGASFYFGNGIYKSTDNGETWSRLPTSNNGSLETFDHRSDLVSTVAVNPTNGHVYAAVIDQIIRSTDGGATWTDALSSGASGINTSMITDVVVTSTGRLYASFSGLSTNLSDGDPGATIDLPGVWTSTTGASGSWTKIAGSAAGGSPTGWNGHNAYGRVVLAVAPSSEEIVYALYWNGISYTCAGPAPEAELFRWNQTTSTWTNLSASLPDEVGCSQGNDPFAVQTGYDLVVAVKPDDPTTVFIGGTNLYRSTNSGASWTRIGGYATAANYAQYLASHSDVHSVVFQPGTPTTMLVGDDGGIRKTTANTAPVVAWTEMNTGYRTYQYYHVVNDPRTGNTKVMGGAQDNGTTRNVGGAGINFESVLSGDGVSVGLADIIGGIQWEYMGFQRGTIITRDATSLPNFGFDITPTGEAGTGLFVTLFKLDPDNTERLYYANDNLLYRTTSASTVAPGSWTTMTGVGTAVGAAIDISAIGLTRGAYSAATSRLYFGTNDGRVYRLNDPTGVAAATAPVNITPPGATAGANVSSIAVDPGDPATILVTYSNYGVPSVFYTANATAATPTWTLVEGNLTLPSFRSSVIARISGVPTFFVGTSAGLYSTTGLPSGGAPTWTQEGSATMGNVVIPSLDLRASDNKLLVGTHGYGMWSATLAAAVPSTTLVINEIDADNPSTDTTEFVEIKNVSAGAINLDNYSVEFVNGNAGGAAVYRTVDLPNFSLPAGGYYVICGGTVPNCNLDDSPNTDYIQNGPDAVAIRLAGTLIDTVSYNGNTGAPYTEGTGAAADSATASVGLSRFADGTDTDNNSADVSLRCITPGAANVAASASCVAAVVTGVTSSTTDGAYNAGDVISIQVTFDQAVTVTGTPTLTLATGSNAVVNYTSGTGTSTLTFNYTVANGQNSADLDYTAANALTLNGGTIQNGATAANLTLPTPGAANSLGANKNLIVDTTNPTAAGTAANVTTGGGNAHALAVTYTDATAILVSTLDNSDINVTGPNAYSANASFTNVDNNTNGSPRQGNYSIVPPGGTWGPEDNGTYNINMLAAQATDTAGNAVTAGQIGSFTVNIGTAAVVTNVSSTTANGAYNAGDAISIQVTFDQAVAVTGTPTLTLATGTNAVVNYTSGTGTTTLNFNYTVANGQNSADLDYTAPNALALNGGTIQNGALAANLTLPTPGAAGSLGANKNLIVDTTNPTAAGSAANVTTSGANSHAIAVTYTDGTAILVSTLDNSDLNVSGPNAFSANATFNNVDNNTNGSPRVGNYTLTPPGGTWGPEDNGTYNLNMVASQATDTAGNAVAAGQIGSFTVSIPAVVTNVTSSTANGAYNAGDVISIQVTFNQPVAVTGTPQLTLATGSNAVVNYTSGTGTNTLTFNYTIASGQNSADLDYAGTNALALNGGTIQNGSVAATLTLPTPGGASSLGANKNLVVDTTNPTAVGNANNVSTAGGVAHPLSATYTDNFAMLVSSFDGADINVTGPNAFGATGSFINVDNNTDGTPRQVNYSLLPPGGSWGPEDNGTYTLNIQAGEVTDTAGNAVATGPIGTFTVNIGSPAVVTGVSSSTGNGSYNAGDVISIQVTFDQAVTVTGTPTLTLATGANAVVNYTSGTGTSTLTFNYTVANGQNSPDLDYTGTNALALNGGTIQNGALAANLALPAPGAAGSLGANKALVVDTSNPTGAGNANNVTTGGGATHPITATYTDNFAMLVSTLDNNDIAVTGPNGFNGAATFSTVDINTNGTPRQGNYSIVPPGGTWGPEDNGTYNINVQNGQVTDVAGNAVAAGQIGSFNVNIGTPAVVTNVTSTTANGSYNAGDVISIQVAFDQAVNVTGTPQLTLATGSNAVVNYTSGTGTNTLTFNYTIANGQNSPDLDYTATNALALNGGSIQNGSGAANLTLPVPAAAGSLGANKNLVVDTTNPTAVGNANNVTTAGGAAHALGVTYTDNFAMLVSTLGNSDVNVTGPNAFNAAANFVSVDTNTDGTPRVGNYSIVPPGGTWGPEDNGTYNIAMQNGQVTDVAGNAVAAGQIGSFTVNIGAPAIVTNVSSSTANGSYNAGDVISIQVTFDQSVTVTGTPTLTLATGSNAVVNYTSGSGTSTLNFNYTVANGQNSPDLDYTGANALALSGGTIQNGALAANLTLPTPGAAGSLGANKNLIIDTTNPTAVGNALSVTTAGGATHAIPVTYTDNFAMLISTFDNNDINVTGPNAFSSGASFISVDVGSNGTPRQGNYSLVPPGGTWGPEDNGTYTLNMQAGQASDVAGNAVAAGAIGTFTVNIGAAAAVVTNVTSSTANGAYNAGDVISIQVTFDQAVTVTGTPQLTLATGNNAVVNYASGSGTNTLTFNYTVANGQNSPDLDYTSVNALALNGGTIQNGAVAAILTLPAPGAVGSLGNNKNLVVDTTNPTATAASASVSTAGGASQAVTANYTDNFAILVSTLNGSDITVTGPNGFNAAAAFGSVDINTNGTPRQGNYSIVPPGGTWGFEDNGTYTLNMQAGQVTDTAGNAVAAGALGTFTVNIPVPPQTRQTVTTVADLPDPSVVGQGYTVNVTVTALNGSTPSGTVTVTDGAGATCTIILPAPSCVLTSTVAGLRTVVATYSGSATLDPSAGGGSHLVNRANTTTTITNVNPEPSLPGQAYVVSFTVTPNAPGAGTPTGNVGISDGAGASCTASVAAGSCTLAGGGAGVRTLTAQYPGDTNFNSSQGTRPHTITSGPTGPGVEGDINRTVDGVPGAGDNKVDLLDLFWYDQFARLLHCPSDTAFNEFQRLDGNDNGVTDGGDYTFIFNTSLALQGPTQSKGPALRPAGLCTGVPTAPSSMRAQPAEGPAVSRTISAGVIKGSAGDRIQVPIEIDARGDEMMTSATITFDPAVLSIDATSGIDANPDVVRGRGATKSQVTGVNAQNVANGMIAIAIDFSGRTGTPLSKGTRQIVMLTFTLRSDVAPGTVTRVGFSDELVPRQTVNSRGTVVNVDYKDASITVGRSTRLTAANWLRTKRFDAFAADLLLAARR